MKVLFFLPDTNEVECEMQHIPRAGDFLDGVFWLEGIKRDYANSQREEDKIYEEADVVRFELIETGKNFPVLSVTWCPLPRENYVFVRLGEPI